MGLAGGAAMVGRAGLPPHFYIEIPARSDISGIYKSNGDFARALSRGKAREGLTAYILTAKVLS